MLWQAAMAKISSAHRIKKDQPQHTILWDTKLTVTVLDYWTLTQTLCKLVSKSEKVAQPANEDLVVHSIE